MTQPQQQQNQPPPPLYTGLQLRQAQDAAVAPLVKRVGQLFHLQGVPVTDDQRSEMAGYLYRPLQTARTRTYTAVARYLHGQGVTDVPALQDYRQDAVETMLQDTVERVSVAGDPVDDSNRDSPIVVEQSRKQVARAASRHAQQPARETVKDYADHAGEEVGWARMLTGARSCAFCAMLASRGPVYRSDKSALYRGGSPASAYHDGCDCIAVLVHKGIPWEGQASHEALEKLWGDTGGKSSGARARNDFRRAWDKSVRGGGSGDFLADSMKPPGGA